MTDSKDVDPEAGADPAGRHFKQGSKLPGASSATEPVPPPTSAAHDGGDLRTGVNAATAGSADGVSGVSGPSNDRALIPGIPLSADRQILGLGLLVGALVFTAFMGWGPLGRYFRITSPAGSRSVSATAGNSAAQAANADAPSVTVGGVVIDRVGGADDPTSPTAVSAADPATAQKARVESEPGATAAPTGDLVFDTGAGFEGAVVLERATTTIATTIATTITSVATLPTLPTVTTLPTLSFDTPVPLEELSRPDTPAGAVSETDELQFVTPDRSVIVP